MKSHIILLVEGTESFRSILSDHLRKNYQVKEFQKCEAAFHFLTQTAASLVLYALPNNQEQPEAFIQELRAHSRTRHLPVVVLYHRHQGLSVRDCYMAGADVCLEKPFGLEWLPEVLTMAIRNRELAFHYSRRLTLLPEAYAARESEPEFFMQRVNRFIRERIDQMQLQVPLLAEEMSLSVSQLDRRIMRITGTSPKQYIRDYRMKVAFELLAENQGNISEVASLTGFKSVSYFSTKFRERFGVPPSQYKFQLKVVQAMRSSSDFPPRVA